MPEKEEYFSTIFFKNLNDHSIGAYKKLYERINVFFKTILLSTYDANAPDSIILIYKSEVSEITGCI